jgi:DNA modification methylase
MYILHQGDCFEYMDTFVDKCIPAVFADPPYGNNTPYNSYEDTRENLVKLVNKLMPRLFRISDQITITPGNNNM